MANIKNYGLQGVASDVQLGKGGIRLIEGGGSLSVSSPDGNFYAPIRSSSLKVSFDGLLEFDNGPNISRASSSTLQISGTGAIIVPVGDTASRPSDVTGALRVNNDIPLASYVEFYNGTEWTALATGGSTGTIQAEIDNIETTLGAAINSDGTFNGAGFTGAGLGSVTSFTDAINTIADNAAGKDTLDEIFPSTANGNVIYSAGGVWVQAAPGATSGVQAYDSDLTAIAGLTTTGYIVRTGSGTSTTRAIAGTAGNIVVTNGDGVSSDTSLNLATVSQAATGNFVKVTLDGFGRVTGNTAVVTSDITGLADSQYLRLDGTTTMSATLNAGGNLVSNVADPVSASDAANKAYVDAVAAGLSWKQAARAATTANITLSGTQTVDGVALIVGDRVLVKDQTLPADNGIYVVAAGAWTRSTDADTALELDSATLFIEEGTINDNTGWTQTATIVTVGTTPQTWVQFSGSSTYIAGDGLLLTGNTFSVNMGAGITTLPSDEVGIDLYDPSTGALILTSDGTSRSTATGDKLFLLLDGAGALGQTSSGLKINASAVTNAMLANPSVGLNADTGTSTLALGQTLEVAGDSVQGIITSVTGQTITVTASDATSSQKGVATFNTGSFSVTAGDVSLSNVGTPVTASFVKLTTDAKGRVVATTAVVSSDITTALGYTPVNKAGDTMSGVLDMGGNNISNLADPQDGADAVNRNYLDSAVAASQFGAIHAHRISNVDLSTDGSVNVGPGLPNNTTILRIKIKITAAASGSTTLTIGSSTSGPNASRFADADSNDPLSVGMYVIECYDTDSFFNVYANITSASGSGTADIIVEYQLSES